MLQPKTTKDSESDQKIEPGIIRKNKKTFYVIFGNMNFQGDVPIRLCELILLPNRKRY